MKAFKSIVYFRNVFKTTVFKTKLSLKGKTYAEMPLGVLGKAGAVSLPAGPGKSCKSSNLNKRNIFNHKEGEMHAM